MSEGLPAGWTSARVRPHGIRPLEVWNLPLTDGRLLWQVVGTPFVETQRARGVADVLTAREVAVAAAEACFYLRRKQPFERLWLCGGLTSLHGFSSIAGSVLGSAPFETRVCPSGAFSGEVGGRGLLARHGHDGGVVADVGQTSIKVSVYAAGSAPDAPPARILRARQLDELPRLLIGAHPITPASARAAVQAAAPWIAEAILDALDTVVPRVVPPAIVLALSCPVSDELVLGPCTYGWAGDASLVARVAGALHAAGAFGAAHVATLVLNDAELAACSAPADVTTLALTLGFGPGAALITPG